jgi:predicted metal-dependent phosphoesterase TrpH
MNRVRLGRADLHVHTLASDGVDGVVTILEHVDATASVDILAITDHDRIDAALAARAIADSRGMRVRVVVGEEISTRGGHILGLFLTERVPPLRSLRETVARIHDQGGVAVAAHPATPYPLCITARSVRRLMDEPDPRHRLDAIEAFNPTTFGRVGHATTLRLSEELGLPAVGGSDAHRVAAVATGLTLFRGATPDDLRAAIAAGETRWAGTFHGTLSQLPTFGRQLAKYGRGWRDGVAGLVRGGGTGRDLGYPGGRLRPARFDAGLVEGPAAGGTTPDGTGAGVATPDDGALR